MQHGLVDLCIVGSDRTTSRGDVTNKIGTYLKALAANDNNIPFYVALPTSTIDWDKSDGISDIEIEERSPDEVAFVDGLYENEIKSVLVPPKDCKISNYGFDVTPNRLISGLITEFGIFKANKEELNELKNIIKK
jgi:methylthioribose-1-phosphate isomerase